MEEKFTVENQININAFYSFFENHYEKNFHFDGEIHDFWEVLYVVEGQLRVSGDERIYNLKSGNMIFHKPMELHKFTITDDDGATLVIFSFSMEGPKANAFNDKVFSLTHRQRAMVEELMAYVKEKDLKTEGLLPYIYLYPSRIYSGYLQNISTSITRLFLSLDDAGSVAESLVTPEALLFKKAVEYMNCQIDTPLTVSMIAKYCAVSESSLKRIFKKNAGLSVHKYFLSLKIKKAVELLQAGKSVTEVAGKLNFSSQSYFSVAFKRETGKLPSDCE